jgi:16S rRNA (guanine527-N7)-methyltransferase
MLAIKGDSAEEELKGARAALGKLGVVRSSVVRAGVGLLEPPSTVVRVEVGESPGGVRFAAKRARAARTRPMRWQ